jgi:hypothetical protein
LGGLARAENFLDMVATTGHTFGTNTFSKKEIWQAQEDCKVTQVLKAAVLFRAVSAVTADSYAIDEDGLLVKIKHRIRKGKGETLEPVLQIVVPDAPGLRARIIGAIHTELGHSASLRTYQAVSERFCWNGMYMDVREKLRKCVECQFHAKRAAKAPLAGHTEADECAEVIAIDVMHLPDVEGYKYMLCCTDVFSRWGMAAPMKDLKPKQW